MIKKIYIIALLLAISVLIPKPCYAYDQDSHEYFNLEVAQKAIGGFRNQ